MNIFDSTSIILFTEVIDEYNCLSILNDDKTILILPKSVYNEVIKNPNHNIDKFISQQVLKLEDNMDPDCENKFRNRYPGLGNGEINVIAWGMKLINLNKNIKCVLDETPARKAAKSYGLNVIGSIGLIKILKTNKLINNKNIENIIELIDNSNFRVNNKILRSLLNE